MLQLLPMKEMDRLLRDNPLRRQNIPLEFRASWWVPFRQESSGRLFLHVFFYRVTGPAGQPKQMERPRYIITQDPASGKVIELSDCALRDFAPDVKTEAIVGALTPDMLPAQTVEGLERHRAEMLAAYDRMMPIVFHPVTDLDWEELESAAHFRRVFEEALEPPLVLFYRALNPKFFDWLATLPHQV